MLASNLLQLLAGMESVTLWGKACGGMRPCGEPAAWFSHCCEIEQRLEEVANLGWPHDKQK